MAILGKDILSKHGCYIAFSVLDEPIVINEIGRFNCPPRSAYESGIFFEFENALLETFCGVTRSYSPFDPCDFIQFETPYAIYEFSSTLLMWEYQLTKVPDNYFGMYLDEFPEFEQYTREQLKTDLLETLHFLIGKLHQAAAVGKCVAIIGF